MIGDPRDRSAYGISLASLGLALAVLLTGICVVSTQHGDITVLHERQCALEIPIHCRPESWSQSISEEPDVPDGLWIALAALAGVFVGTLIHWPLPESARSPNEIRKALQGRARRTSLAALALAVILGLGTVLADSQSSLLAVLVPGAAAVGIMLGLLIPSPARRN